MLFCIKKAHRENSNESKLNSLSKYLKIQPQEGEKKTEDNNVTATFWIFLFFRIF